LQIEKIVYFLAKKMGLRRSGVTKDYEEMPGANVPTGLEGVETNRDHPQEFELSSVSVVPDGKH